MALANLSEIKNGLGITSTDFDAQIVALINPVSALIEREAGRKFGRYWDTQWFERALP